LDENIKAIGTCKYRKQNKLLTSYASLFTGHFKNDRVRGQKKLNSPTKTSWLHIPYKDLFEIAQNEQS